MQQDTSLQVERPNQSLLLWPLDEVVRGGAQQLLQAALMKQFSCQTLGLSILQFTECCVEFSPQLARLGDRLSSRQTGTPIANRKTDLARCMLS